MGSQLPLLLPINKGGLVDPFDEIRLLLWRAEKLCCCECCGCGLLEITLLQGLCCCVCDLGDGVDVEVDELCL